MRSNRVRIKENSFIARMAATRLGTERVAIVIGNTIHLYHTTRAEFLKNQSWVLHELKHVEQYHSKGMVCFFWQYLIESLRNGYHNNAFEKEARNAENDLELLNKYILTP